MKTLSKVWTTKHPFIQGMKAQHVQKLLAGATVVEFAPGEVIFREGDPADHLYLIESGAVEITSRSAGSTLHLETVCKGEALGWSWLFPPFAWHFEARAIETTHVTSCNGAHLLVEAEEDHDIGYELMKRVSQIVIHRLQATRRKLAEDGSLISVVTVVGRT